MFSKPERETAQRKATPKTDQTRKGLVQTKVKVGPPNDKYEQEADAMADKVMSMPAPKAAREGIQRKGTVEHEEAQTKPLASLITPLVQRMSPEEEEPQAKSIQRMSSEEEEPQTKPIQRMSSEEEEPQTKPVQRMSSEEEEPQTKAIQRMSPEEEPQTKPIQRMSSEEEEPQTKTIQKKGEGGEAGSSLESRLNASKGGGNALPTETQEFMGSRFGTDFSSVKVHTDSSAVQMNKELNSQAFAHGSDVYFNQGKYDTSSSSGKHLLAHELTHTVQQSKDKKVQRFAPGAPAAVKGLLGIAGLEAVEAITLGLSVAGVAQQVGSKSGGLMHSSDNAKRIMKGEPRPLSRSYKHHVLLFGAKKLLSSKTTGAFVLEIQSNDYGEILSAFVKKDLSLTTSFYKSTANVNFKFMGLHPQKGGEQDPRAWPLRFYFSGNFDPTGNGEYDFEGYFDFNAFGMFKPFGFKAVNRSALEFATPDPKKIFFSGISLPNYHIPKLPKDQRRILIRNLHRDPNYKKRK